MKTIRIILIFLMLFLPFVAWWYVIKNFPIQYNDQPYPFLTIMGIGQVLLLLGFIILIILDRWCELQLALRREDGLKHDKEIELKKRNIQALQDDADRRRAHEARKQPDKEMATIIQASKLANKKTTETPQEVNTTIVVKEITESEKFDFKIFETAVENFKELSNLNHQT